MVLTQLQLKWPNHSTQLLTGLKYLFKNEQLVDCTLKCNKHTLKVHRSVLAACSPYFERELENNPLIVIKDMQFNVLQALIEFMYYGETRITEENLTSLIEAAKLFEIKGLSEMDLLTSSENNVIPSVTVNANCTLESSFLPENLDDAVFENGSSTVDSVLKSHIDEAISKNVPNKRLSDNEDANCNLIMQDANSQSHSSRDFVITPPQTESAQILLSLACSYSPKQYLSAMPDEGIVVAEELQNGSSDDKLVNRHHHQNLNNNLLFDEPSLIISNSITSSSSSTDSNSIVIEPHSLPLSSLPHQTIVAAKNVADFVDTSSTVCDDETLNSTKHNGGDVSFVQQHQHQPQQQQQQQVQESIDCNKSLLAKLLTRNNQNVSKNCSSIIGSTRYDGLYDSVDSSSINNQNGECVARVAATSTTTSTLTSTSISPSAPASASVSLAEVDLQPRIILECPFLIETSNGYVDVSVENMINVLQNSGDIFAPHSKNTVKIISKEEVTSLADADPTVASAAPMENRLSLLSPLHTDQQPFNDAVLERIQQDTEDELKDDPEAVVLTRITEDGQLEKYVLSSADVMALQQMNDQRRKLRELEVGDSVTSVTPLAAHIDVELPLSSGNGDVAVASLITRIVQFGAPVDHAISKLPFRRSGRPLSSLAVDADSDDIPATSSAGCLNGGSSETLITEVTLHQSHLQPQQPHSQHQSHHHHHHPHHENMFEELDSQFNMDCSIEHIQREYVAYEEASKNETQLEHNYYANALKDEDEECVVISAGEKYNLPAMMLMEQPLTNGNGLGEKCKPGTVSYHHIIDTSDVYLNNVVAGVVSSEKKELLTSTTTRRNGLMMTTGAATPAAATTTTTTTTTTTNTSSKGISGGGDKCLFNNKTDLILNNDALMSSVVASRPVAGVSNLCLTNGTSRSGITAVASTASVAAVTLKTNKGRTLGRTAVAGATSNSSGTKLLPFKSVKNTNREKKPRRTYKRKAPTEVNSRSLAIGGTAEKRKNENVSLNGDFLFPDTTLVEEIIVDEIS